MKAILYKTTSDNNVINKELTDPHELEVFFKDDEDITQPTIKLKINKKYLDYNYCYIEDLKRYYFIDDIRAGRGNTFMLFLNIDVLETYKKELENCRCIVIKSNSINKNYNGGLLSLEDFTSDIYKSNKKPDLKNAMVLVTMGVKNNEVH